MKTKQDFKLQNVRNRSFIARQIIKNRYLYIMLIPVLAYYILFHYAPMYGAQIAFKNFSMGRGSGFEAIWNSPWVGFKYFIQFFNSYYFDRLIRNTILLSIYMIFFTFPAPIVLALLLNEVRNKVYKSTIQSISYLPHFISLVVICGMVLDFLRPDGIVNSFIVGLGLIDEPIRFMLKPEWFRSMYVISQIWQQVGWGSIIYLAALSAIDPTLYESAVIDGAGRWKQLWHITIPSIIPTIIILFILRMGHIMNLNGQKILLLYNPAVYETADVIASFVFRRGIQEADYSFTTAIGLFNSAINFAMLIIVNKLSRKLTESSLW